MSTDLASKPEDTKALIVRSLKLYRKTFTKVAFMGFFLSLVLFLPTLISLTTGIEIFTNLSPMSPQRLWILVIDLLTLMFFSEIIWRMHCSLHHKKDTLAQDIIISLKKLPFIFIAAVLQSAIIAIVSITFFMSFYLLPTNQLVNGGSFVTGFISIIFLLQSLVAIYLFLAFFFYLPLIVVENKGVVSSLKRSFNLVWGQWWRTAKIQIIPWVAYLIVLILIRYFIHINVSIFFVQASEVYSWLATCIQILVFTLFTPWFAAVMLVQLRDLELRKNLKSRS